MIFKVNNKNATRFVADLLRFGKQYRIYVIGATFRMAKDVFMELIDKCDEVTQVRQDVDLAYLWSENNQAVFRSLGSGEQIMCSNFHIAVFLTDSIHEETMDKVIEHIESFKR